MASYIQCSCDCVVSLWSEDICEGPVEGLSVGTVAGDAVDIVLHCGMVAVASSCCNDSSPAVYVGHTAQACACFRLFVTFKVAQVLNQ
jgi:hypothetical protein